MVPEILFSLIPVDHSAIAGTSQVAIVGTGKWIIQLLLVRASGSFGHCCYETVDHSAINSLILRYSVLPHRWQGPSVAAR